MCNYVWIDWISGLNFMVEKVGAIEALSENNMDVTSGEWLG